MKEFKTIGQLVSLMETRGIETDAETPVALMSESYYAIINGYKTPFLDRDAMQRAADDRYLPGTRFKQIYDLFRFDRDLRTLTMGYLLRAESLLKTATVYAFCKRHPDPDDYLNRENYAGPSDMLVPKAFKGNKRKMHADWLAGLMKVLNGKLVTRPDTPDYIRHYMESYGFVPLWVLQNNLTFGNMKHFYQLQRRGVQSGACKMVGEVTGHGRAVTPLKILRSYEILSGFRNICAHGERLYCARVKGAAYDTMLDYLRLVLPESDTDEMASEIGGLAGAYRGRIDPRALNAMYTDPSDIPVEFK